MPAPTTILRPPQSARSLVVVVRTEGGGTGRAVLHPYGLTMLHPAGQPTGIALAGTLAIDGQSLTWAWGYVEPDRSTPAVWFDSRTGLRSVRGASRRLTSRLWAAHAPGYWPTVRVG